MWKIANGTVCDQKGRILSYYERNRGSYQCIITPSGVPFLKQETRSGPPYITSLSNPLELACSIEKLPIDLTQPFTFTTENKRFPNWLNQPILGNIFLQTHNCVGVSFAKQYEWFPCMNLNSANQSIPLFGQLRYGVRSLEFELHTFFGELYISHGPTFFDTRRMKFLTFCKFLRAYLEEFPTLIIIGPISNQTKNTDYHGPTAIAFNQILESTGLAGNCLSSADLNTSVPDLISQGKYLLWLTGISTPNGPNYTINNYDYVVASNYSFKTIPSLMAETVPDWKPTNLKLLCQTITPKFQVAADPRVSSQLNQLMGQKLTGWNQFIQIMSADFIQLPGCEAFFLYQTLIQKAQQSHQETLTDVWVDNQNKDADLKKEESVDSVVSMDETNSSEEPDPSHQDDFVLLE